MLISKANLRITKRFLKICRENRDYWTCSIIHHLQPQFDAKPTMQDSGLHPA